MFELPKGYLHDAGTDNLYSWLSCWKTSSPKAARLCISYVDGLSLQVPIGVSVDRDQGALWFPPDPPQTQSNCRRDRPLVHPSPGR